MNKEMPVEPKRPLSPQELHNFEDAEAMWEDVEKWQVHEIIEAAAVIGRWDEQIARLRQQGYLNGENTTYDKELR